MKFISVYRNKDEKDLEGYGPNRWGSLVGMDKLSQPAWFHALRLYDSEELDIVYQTRGIEAYGKKAQNSYHIRRIAMIILNGRGDWKD